MDEKTRQELPEVSQKGEITDKEHLYVCRSCGVTAPKKKGLCRPEKIRRVTEGE